MSIRLLLADDHELFLEGVGSLLDGEQDMQIVARARDGREAVALALREKPDLAVMDVSMPGMNGIEATRLISAMPGCRVLGLSMHAERRFVAAVLRAGACGYLLKNAAVEELVRAIRTVAGGRPYLSPSIAGSVLEAFRDEEQDTPLSLLTGREREVLQLLAEGHPSRAIAERLSVSIKTVGTHREHLMEKLGVHSVAELTKLAIREGVTSVDG